MIDFLTEYLSAFQPHSQTEFTIFAVISMIFSALGIFLGYKLTKLWSTLIDIPVLTLIVSIVVGIIAGVLSIILLRPFIIVTTAISGSFGFAGSLFALFPAATQSTRILGLSWPILLVGAILSIIGIVVQFVTTKKHSKRA